MSEQIAIEPGREPWSPSAELVKTLHFYDLPLIGVGDDEALARACALTRASRVVETGVDPVTYRFSGGRSAD